MHSANVWHAETLINMMEMYGETHHSNTLWRFLFSSISIIHVSQWTPGTPGCPQGWSPTEVYNAWTYSGNTLLLVMYFEKSSLRVNACYIERKAETDLGFTSSHKFQWGKLRRYYKHYYQIALFPQDSSLTIWISNRRRQSWQVGETDSLEQTQCRLEPKNIILQIKE